MMSQNTKNIVIQKLRNNEILDKLEEELFVKEISRMAIFNHLSFTKTMNYIRSNFGDSMITKYRNTEVKIEFNG